eukprot:CAMPEP_0178402076 /NCGR_PEP_ID=MMETSP0689_2-20121128/16649_1 /TAXON_ID=160604 /ORGANISM="Amphidinium massartii, Strain CS-259" /LENGTH=650 /DNA_ID=CAMNT_0020022953 /DNA_START=99 /DNA_END=2047 /DNA_ORIENTATION=+
MVKNSTKVLAATSVTLAAVGFNSQAFLPTSAPGRVSTASIEQGAATKVDAVNMEQTSTGLLAMGCAAAVASAGINAAVQRKGRGAKKAVVRQAEGEFAAGLNGGQSAFSSMEYNFDPLGFSEKYPEALPYFREAELKHGRIAMLAWVGLVVPEFVRIPGPEKCYQAKTVVEAHNACVETGALVQVFAFVGFLELVGTWPKMNNMPYLPLSQSIDKDGLTLENAGDYRLGAQFLPDDPDAAKEMKLKELKNGRLAMLAFGGAITQAVLTGNGFPWLYAEAQEKVSSLVSSAHMSSSRPMIGARTKVARRAEEGGYKMSKAVPFLPMSPALEGYVGAEEEGFDPMGFSLALDIRWLREAELKHGRICMLATVGWIATDLGLRVPGPAYQVSTIEAHDAMVKFGAMTQILTWIGLLEVFGFLAITNMIEGTTNRQPGDFGLRKLYPTDPEGQYQMQLKELRNGRLAMLAFSGIVTSAVLTGKTWPFLGAVSSKQAASVATSSTFCGKVAPASAAGATVMKAKETSYSMPFMPKPKNLAGWVGGEAEFDPIGMSDWFDMKWLRESELKHGRVAMMATVGFALQPSIGSFPGVTMPADSLKAAAVAPPEAWFCFIFAAGYIESSVYNGKITQLNMFEDNDRVPGVLGFGSSRLEG